MYNLYDDITQTSNRWCIKCFYQTTMTVDHTSSTVKHVRYHQSKRTDRHVVHVRTVHIAFTEGQHAHIIQEFREGRINKRRKCIIRFSHFNSSCPDQHHLKTVCVTVQCVPVGSCSGQCCGSGWSLHCLHWYRTVRTVYSRSRSAEQ